MEENENPDFDDGNPNIIKMSDGLEPTQNGLGYELHTAMKRYHHKVAQIIVDSDEEDTYEQLRMRSIRTALKLLSKGISRDDIIGIFSGNHKNSSVPFLASLFIGVKVVSFDPTMSIKDTAHLLKQITPVIIFTIGIVLKKVESAIEEAEVESQIVVFEDSNVHESFAEYLEVQENEGDFEPIKLESNKETAVILFSSGTTGFPKGICISHYAIICQCLNLIISGNLPDLLLSYATLYWISSVVFYSALILAGAARLIPTGFSGQQIWDIIIKYKVTAAFLSPFQCLEMYNSGRPDGEDTSHFLYLATAGASLNPTLMMKLGDLLPGTFIFQAYGQTEVAGILTNFRMAEVQDHILLTYRPQSCGKPIPGVCYKIVNPDTGEILGPNEQGELRVKTRYVMNGYYNMDSSSSFDSNGWLKTGDICYYDERQCFYIVDRIKELLKYRSWHIPPAMLETILLSHPAVQKAIVIGIPHEEDGDHPMGLVVLNDNYRDISPDDIEQFVEGQVQERQRLRAGVKIIQDIPVTSTGKMKRQVLRDMVIKGEL